MSVTSTGSPEVPPHDDDDVDSDAPPEGGQVEQWYEDRFNRDREKFVDVQKLFTDNCLVQTHQSDISGSTDLAAIIDVLEDDKMADPQSDTLRRHDVLPPLPDAASLAVQEQLLRQVADRDDGQQASASDYEWSDADEDIGTADADSDGGDSCSVHEVCQAVLGKRGEYARGMGAAQNSDMGLCDCDLRRRKCTCADQERLPPHEKNGEQYHKVRNTFEGHCASRLYIYDACSRWQNHVIVALSHKYVHPLRRYTHS
jgi:hypothetical protein